VNLFFVKLNLIIKFILLLILSICINAILNFQHLVAQSRATLTLSQSAANDWRQGEYNLFEVGTSLDAKKQLKYDSLCFNFHIKYAIGALLEKNKTKDYENLRATDNEFFSEVLVKYILGWQIDPFFSTSVLTQITESHRFIGEKKVRTAKLWDPVTSQQAMGFAYSYRKKANSFNTRLGISLKQIRADKHTQLTNDPKTRDIIESYKSETGIQFRNDAFFKIKNDVVYRGVFEMFGNFDDLSKWTVKCQNEFQVNLWKLLSMLLNADIMYDEKQMKDIQYRQHLRIGLVATF